jgi:hypothetical protein
MVWRSTATAAKQRDGASRRAAMQSKVEAGVPIGILGYRDGAPIAWCSIAPRDTYRHLGGLMISKRLNESGRWRASSLSESIAATGSRKSCFWQPLIMPRAMARP